MSRPLDDLLGEQALSPAFRRTVETYADQGGLVGALTYALVVLETDDDALAADLAAIPTNLFVTSALHDDAIDEADTWSPDDRKRRLNERVTVGDLVYTNVLEAAASLPDGVDLTTVPSDLGLDRTSGPGADLPSALEAIREIGRGQLGEDRLEPREATLEDAIARVEARGAVWGDLAVALVAAASDYSASQLETLRQLTTDGMFVPTVLDDVEDLPADVANGVANVPRALYDGDLSRYDSEAAVVEAFLDSDAPDRLETLLAERWATIEAAAREFAASLHHPETAVLEALQRALSWYCESVCSIPVARTVPPEYRRSLRNRLAGDEESTRQAIESSLADVPLETWARRVDVDVDALAAAAVELPADPLADVLAMSAHAATVADDLMSTSLADALAGLERRAAASQSTRNQS